MSSVISERLKTYNVVWEGRDLLDAAYGDVLDTPFLPLLQQRKIYLS